jgi:pimeloyl-ACP methyl ester carboxylesterase
VQQDDCIDRLFGKKKGKRRDSIMSTSKPQQEENTSVSRRQSPSSFSPSRTLSIFLVVAILLILGGGIIANVAQTAGGQVAVREVQFAGTNGVLMSGLLYIPNTATSKTPACGVVAIHGYINSRDTMDGFAIEMAGRGCVVLAVDQAGHGFSDAPAFANGYGGPDALAYLDSLDIVQKNDIGLIGHSMGGWASVEAAGAHSGDYRSLVLVSSSTSTPPYEPIPGSPTFPRNVQVVEARCFPKTLPQESCFGLWQAA